MPPGGAGLPAGELDGRDRALCPQPDGKDLGIPGPNDRRRDAAVFSHKAQELHLVITSYGTLLRMPVLADIAWRLVILDEAQAIKNANAE